MSGSQVQILSIPRTLSSNVKLFCFTFELFHVIIEQKRYKSHITLLVMVVIEDFSALFVRFVNVRQIL